jgi:Trypsin
MQRQAFFNGLPTNNNFMMNNFQNACNCIQLRQCNPLIDMARTMYNGFIANFINSQLQINVCKYENDEMYVCCSNFNGFDSHYKNYWQNVPNFGYQPNVDWKGLQENSGENVEPQNYHQYTSYPIQGFLPYTKSTITTVPKIPFTSKHEDPVSKKNSPPPLSIEFPLDKNKTFFNTHQTNDVDKSRAMKIVTAPPPLNAQTKTNLINQDKCGRSSDSRIIGGEESGIGQFLWIARLAYRNKTSQLISYRCAGSLINEKYVLTAAHCVSNLISTLEL